MPPSVSPPSKYADLELRNGRSARGYKEYEYVGTRAPSWDELEKLSDLFMANARDLHLNGGGITNVKGAPVAMDARNCNALILNFPDKESFDDFLKRPMLPAVQGISLQLVICKPRIG
jgi:hypothetical protein